MKNCQLLGILISLLFSSASHADIEKLGFLTGTWTGPAFGGTAKEVWQAPMAKTMVGTFSGVLRGGRPFFEFFIIEETDQGTVMRWNHYNADYTRWEESTNEHWLKEAGDNSVNFEMKTPVKGLPANIVYKVVGNELIIWVGDLNAEDKSGAIELRLSKDTQQ